MSALFVEKRFLMMFFELSKNENEYSDKRTQMEYKEGQSWGTI